MTKAEQIAKSFAEIPLGTLESIDLAQFDDSIATMGLDLTTMRDVMLHAAHISKQRAECLQDLAGYLLECIEKRGDRLPVAHEGAMILPFPSE